MKNIETLKTNYDSIASRYYETRIESFTGKSGYTNRLIEKPLMFKMVPNNIFGCLLIDVGCGPGIHLQEYSRRGANTYGVDISPKMVDIASENCQQSTLRVASAHDIPYENDKFDIITCSLVLDHIENIALVLKEFKRIIKNGGKIYLTVPHPVVHMYRKSKDLAPSHSYFDKSYIYYDIVGSGLEFIGHPRTISDYINLIVDLNLSIDGIAEPTPQMADKYILSKHIPFFLGLIISKK